ncbi:hypothetical protein B0J11DRAFT_509722 [Dendryphion nanum]|uniref:Uncharacterized protein n=1 Tax=Dendryphion nanum TaxID=256645 RepID=A0A9P9DCH1_9PLEO|nr:hypothetical protein B0J11DRAFT_509722 [Dendryphion nanum]
MRLSYCILVAASSVAAIPIPAPYAWTFTQWSSGWYGIGWANFRLNAPETKVGGVTIPAISLSKICSIISAGNGKGGETMDCNSLIVGEPAGRALEFTFKDFDISIQQVQFDAVYRFESGGK